MANLYNQQLYEKGPGLARCDYSLFNLLTSDMKEVLDGLALDRQLMVDGVKIHFKGSAEFDEYMSNFRRKLEKGGMPLKKAESVMERMVAQEFIAKSAPFSAMDYRGKKLLYTDDGGVIGEIAMARRQIDFFYLAGCLVDMAKKARGGGWHYYDGSLSDALIEFQQGGFTFNLLETMWYPHYLENGERAEGLRLLKPIIRENVSIDEIVSCRD